ncbi:tetratricopeptide repeat protein [Umezawaea endophytica]|uniref:Tetratricopeptide repeat protein n=1 Tax=Umezawaea endophytica TaxID=1654476 RepID=A0A9X2VV48_9PSEU|nr:tetratricopeptide repeat protein [Umezawaea endophytica]MCS7483229.1 tetratricopeptide repeat protein [Umezawaea endophytica]
MTHNAFSGKLFGNVVQGRDITLSLPPAPPVAVAGLPAQPVFVGRERELALLIAALRPVVSEQTVVVWSLGGLAGIGKTALAVRAARTALHEGWFPGGVVMVNMRGYDLPGERVSASAALASLLGALGVTGQHVPADAEDRARLWRSVLAERERTLILADNASSVDQVRPLLPGTAEHRVVITSRHRLADLEGARLFDLDVLPFPEAVAMLADELATSDPDDGRVRDDPGSADVLVRLCGGLPLAIRVAAALLASDPARSVAEMANDLAEDHRRLEELHYSGSLAVRAAFDLSYRHLEDSHARLFRLIAVNPGPEIGVDAVAALVGSEVSEVKRPVRELVRANLLQPGSASGRWRMHDLLRLYAAEAAAKDPEREAAVVRLLDHYRTWNYAASVTFVEPPLPAAEHPVFVDRFEALKWVDAERANLVTAVSLAFTSGRYSDAVGLSLEMHEYLFLRNHWDDALAVHDLAQVAARLLGDRRSEALLLNYSGTAHRRSGHLDEALACHQQAAAIFQELGDLDGEGLALHYGGKVHRDLGDWQASIDSCRRALLIFAETGRRFEEGAVLFNLAVALGALGRFSEAVECHLRDLEICRSLGFRSAEGRTLNQLGVLHRKAGRFADAVEHHRQSLLIPREGGDPNGEADTLVDLGITYRDWGRVPEAIDCLRKGLEVYERLPGSGPAILAAEVRELLSTIE